MKTTSAHSSFQPKAFIISIVPYIVFLVGAIFAFILAWQDLSAESDPSQSSFSKYSALFIPSFIILVLVIGLLGSIFGAIRGIIKIRHDSRQIKLDNPYQYYKELPNNFGIGVASLLSNSKLENEKDIVAALLDLCAQGYLHLSKHSDHYVIRLSPARTRPSLKNEAYLLNLISKNCLSNIDYRKWYDLCVEDGVNLGLYKQNRFTAQLNSSAPNQKPRSNAMRIIFAYILAAIGGIIAAAPFAYNDSDRAFVVFGIVTVTIIIVSTFIIMSRNISKSSYKLALTKHLVRTSKGVNELQKLEAFRAFLAQFNTFVYKDPEAVVLWDRYLSYAQVFGLADELMKTGYSQLINNATFQIDNINNTSLANIAEDHS